MKNSTEIGNPSEIQPVELFPDRLFALGGPIELDGRISWVPDSASGWEPFQCYLIRGSDGALLIDTGAGTHAELIISQLRTLLPQASSLSIVLTRTELDCATNVAAIEECFVVDSLVYTGGILVPRGPDRAPDSTKRIAVSPGESVVADPIAGIELEMISPKLRLLPTLWPYDPVSRTLFVSDAFGDRRMERNDDPPICSKIDPPSLPNEVRESLLTKFGWFTGAETAPIADDLKKIFESRDIQALAPTHGCVIAGSDAVSAQAEVLEGVIRSVGR